MKYDAFISYRHSDLDMFVAKKIHKDLETFKVPRSVQKKSGKKSIKRVFRDQEELPIGSDLTDNISGALVESEYLLVICSPRTPESYWVSKEIDSFIKLHDREHVLAILIEGEPNESFPPQLLTDENGNPVEPLAADVRGETRKEMKKKMKTEVMRLAAPLLHCSYDDLRQRHRERRIKKAFTLVTVIGSIIAALGVAFGAYSTKKAIEIEQNYMAKQVNQSKYLAETSLRIFEDGDRRAAVLIAKEALPTDENDRPYVGEAIYALSEALNYYGIGNKLGSDKLLYHTYPLHAFEYDKEGKYITTIDQAQDVHLWDVETGKKLFETGTFYTETGYLEYVKYANVLDEKLFVVLDDVMYVYGIDGAVIKEIKLEDNITYADGFAENSKIFLRRGNVCTVVDTASFEMKTITGAGDSLSRDISCSSNGQYVAISNYKSDAETGSVEVFDLKNNKKYRYFVEGNFISDIYIEDNGKLFVASIPFDNLLIAADEDGNMSVIVDKFVVGSSKETESEWTHVEKIKKSIFSDGDVFLKARCYSDAYGEHDEALLAAANIVYAIDAKTGDVIAETGFSSMIRSFHASKESGVAYVGEESGYFDFLNASIGQIYSDYTYDLRGKRVRDIKIKGGRVAIQAFASPNITILGYHTGSEVKEVTSCDDSVRKIAVSDSGKYYAAETGTFYYGVELFNAETNEKLYSFTTGDEYKSFSSFIDDKTYLYTTGNGKFYFFNAENGSEELADFGEEETYIGVNTYLTENKKYALLYGYGSLRVIDLAERKTLFTYLPEGSVRGAVLTNDGKTIYFISSKGGFMSVDTQTGTLKDDYPEELQIYPLANDQSSLSMDKDEELFAICCKDSILRIYDNREGKVIGEIPFPCMSRVYTKFSDDGLYLYLQGDDYYFNIYGIEEGEYVYTFRDQINEITSIVDYPDKEMTVVMNNYEIMIFDYLLFDATSVITNGKAYNPSTNKMYMTYYETIYEAPFAGIDTLWEEIETQFPGEELSTEERIRYLVD